MKLCHHHSKKFFSSESSPMQNPTFIILFHTSDSPLKTQTRILSSLATASVKHKTSRVRLDFVLLCAEELCPCWDDPPNGRSGPTRSSLTPRFEIPQAFFLSFFLLFEVSVGPDRTVFFGRQYSLSAQGRFDQAQALW